MTPEARELSKRISVDTDIYERVRQVGPVAKKLLLEEGLDDQRVEFTMDIPCEEPAMVETDDNLDQFIEWTRTVYAVGIAVGLLLRPEVFEKGRAR